MIVRVTSGSCIWNAGWYLRTGSSHESLPSCTSRPSAVAVKALVFEPMAKRVSASTFSPASRLRTPKPSAKTTCWSLTTATATPGTFHSSRACSMWAPSPARGSRSVWASVGAATRSARTAAAVNLRS